LETLARGLGDSGARSYTYTLEMLKALALTRIATRPKNFDVLLTVHLSIFILVINQLDAQNLFYNKFISCLTWNKLIVKQILYIKLVNY